MENNDRPLDGILYEGKFYELTSGKCLECDLFALCDDFRNLPCVGFPDLDPEKYNNFRFSQSITDKINGKWQIDSITN